MDDIQKELGVRRRITAIFIKTSDTFDSKEAYDNYLETVEDIIYKLSYDIDVAEVEQQVQDYIRQEAAAAGATAAADAGSYVPLGMGPVIQPMPAVQVEMDQQGTLVVNAAGSISRQQWLAMAKASGWSEGIATRRALQDAFASIFI